jgi:hypothetical protein
VNPFLAIYLIGILVAWIAFTLFSRPEPARDIARAIIWPLSLPASILLRILQ